MINILGAIRRGSLILIDDLHPTLEIRFIGMLKRILQHFNSKALMATHSVVMVREIPSDCVHVFGRTDEGLVVMHDASMVKRMAEFLPSASHYRRVPQTRKRGAGVAAGGGFQEQRGISAPFQAGRAAGTTTKPSGGRGIFHDEVAVQRDYIERAI